MIDDGLIRLAPVFHHKIWGGRRLNTVCGYEIPEGSVGECWAISAHEHGDCVVEGGPWSGRVLSELWRDHRELFGGIPGDRFPLLVKVLDADRDLSIQVHPDDAYAGAHENGSLGKRECWYVMAAEPDATIIVGQRARSRSEFSQLVNEGRWGELLNEIPVHAGDFFQIDPGCVHAIKAGTLLVEVQQSSDVTYRVYDYGRLGDDGRPRDLHLEKALDVIDYACVPPATGAIDGAYVGALNGVQILESNESYTVARVQVAGERVELDQTHPFMCVSVVGGAGRIGAEDAQLGDHFLVPATVDRLVCMGEMTLICAWV